MIVPTLAEGICLPLRVTILKPPPKPRTVTSEPSPFTRLIDTPEIRCRDSAKLVSGNLPISSAEIASTTPEASRFVSIALSRLPRIPVTTTSSIDSDSATVWPATIVPAAAARIAEESLDFLNILVSPVMSFI